MIRVNLLPWRAERRIAQRKHLAVLAAGVTGIALMIIVAVHGGIATVIAKQEDRNAFLKSENSRFDKEIEEIKKLRDEIAALLARKQVIERLQADRSQAVNLLDQLVRQTPDGVYLRSLKQQGLGVSLVGYAQSNARVSTLMRNFGSSPHLESPVLVEIKAATVNAKRVSEFSMSVRLKQSEALDAGKGVVPAKSAAGK